jgi:hypothetical protein
MNPAARLTITRREIGEKIMGYALLWVEGLTVALLCLALAASWAARGSPLRALWPAAVGLSFALLAALAAHATGWWQKDWGRHLPTDLFWYSLSWLVAYLVASYALLRYASHRPAVGVARAGAGWPRGNLWLGLGGSALAFGLTLWNLDLAARADLAVARLEAGDVLATIAPPPTADCEQAARLYTEAAKGLLGPIREPWHEACWAGQPADPRGEVNWKDPYIVDLVARQEKVLALLRKAAALPACNLQGHRSLEDPAAWSDAGGLQVPLGGMVRLLAIDAHVKAAQGDLDRAFEDVAAILGMSRHAPAFFSALVDVGVQTRAWRTLEGVLWRAAPAKVALPAAPFPQTVSPLRALHRDMAVFGMICPALLSQDPLRYPEVRRLIGPWSRPPLVWATQGLLVPGTRVFLMPDELSASRRKWEAYRRLLQSPEETPADWAAARRLIVEDPTGLYSAVWTKPKERKLLSDVSNAAAFHHLAAAGLAAARYRTKHSRYPERLEQLVPAFLPAMPTDPRDGQALRIKHLNDVVVLYTAKDSAGLDAESSWDAEKHKDEPVFRLHPGAAAK